MLEVAAVALALVVLLASTIAWKLLRLAARHRELPELLIGVFFAALAIEFGDYGQRLLGLSSFDARPVLFCLSVGSLLLFDWLVFRPRSLAAAAVTCITLAVVLSASSLYFAIGAASLEIRTVWGLGRAISLGWAFGESLRYWRLMRRRVAVGAADPVVANRFALWTIWTGAMTALPVAGLVTRTIAILRGGIEPWEASGQIEMTLPMAAFMALILSFVCIAAGALWLSFFPTRRHLASVRTRAAQGAGVVAA